MEKFIESFTKSLSQFADFKGRTGRMEFWYAFAGYLAIYVLASILSYIPVIGFIAYLAYLAALIPTAALFWRRMHDIGKSGLFSLIPLYDLYLASQVGESTENAYGPAVKQD